jgi:hypothetical protein
MANHSRGGRSGLLLPELPLEAHCGSLTCIPAPYHSSCRRSAACRIEHPSSHATRSKTSPPTRPWRASQQEAE